jgi:hypothetical protein
MTAEPKNSISLTPKPKIGHTPALVPSNFHLNVILHLSSFPGEHFPRGFLSKIPYAFLASPIIAKSLAHHSLLDFTSQTILYELIPWS